MVEVGLKYIANNASGLTALIGTRFVKVPLPQGTAYPACSYQRIDEPTRVRAMGSDPGLVQARYQVNCYGEKREGAGGAYSALEVADQIVSAFNRIGEADQGGVTICDIFARLLRDDFDAEAEVMRVIVELNVWYRE